MKIQTLLEAQDETMGQAVTDMIVRLGYTILATVDGTIILKDAMHYKDGSVRAVRYAFTAFESGQTGNIKGIAKAIGDDIARYKLPEKKSAKFVITDFEPESSTFNPNWTECKKIYNKIEADKRFASNQWEKWNRHFLRMAFHPKREIEAADVK